MYNLYRKTKEEEGIYADNEWNADESVFRVGVVQSGKTVWTYIDIKVVEALNPDDCTLVTIVEAISAAGRTIPAFVILSGQLLKVKHLDKLPRTSSYSFCPPIQRTSASRLMSASSSRISTSTGGIY